MENQTKKIMVEKGFYEKNGKQFDCYFIKGNVRGLDVVAAVKPPDFGGYKLLEIVFNGDLSAHPDFNVISAFIESRGLSCVYFKDYPLTDIGSIIVEPDSDGGSVTSDF